MASFSSRTRVDRPVLLVALLVTAAGCATRPGGPGAPDSAAGAQSPATAAEPVAAPAPEPAYEAGVELPAGNGRDILVGACLSCHDLGGLALFKGFYTRASWRELVLTMQSQGAIVDAAEVETLADYLARHFGPDSP